MKKNPLKICFILESCSLMSVLEPPQVVIVTDPGPDPDDVKALITAAVAHKRNEINLIAVVANGGHQQQERARLARTLLDLCKCNSVLVGIGRYTMNSRPSKQGLQTHSLTRTLLLTTPQ